MEIISFSEGISLTPPPNKDTSDPPLLGLTINKSLKNLAPWPGNYYHTNHEN